METRIALFDIRYNIKTAGPSPYNNERTELYFAGCKKAASGNPCPDCFNPTLWNPKNFLTKTPQEFLDCLNYHHINKYITIVGGEPTDQLEGLKEFGKIAKNDGYHIILITWHDICWMYTHFTQEELEYFDVIVPGQYEKEYRIYNESKIDGIHNVIGSANQLVWLPKDRKIFAAGEINSISLNQVNILGVTLTNGQHYSF